MKKILYDYLEKNCKGINNAEKSKSILIKLGWLDMSNRTFRKMIQDINSDKNFPLLIGAVSGNHENADYEKSEIERQQKYREQDYKKEQRASYIDYMNKINQTGSNAQNMGDLGLQNSGYSETSQVAMYNTYQNRVAVARDSFNKAIDDFNAEKTKIDLQNDSNLMEISLSALKEKAALAIQQMQDSNSLLENKLSAQLSINSEYYNRYQNVLSQINTENALAEQVRQYNESLAFQKSQQAESIRQYNESLAYQKARDKVSDAQWEKQYNLSKSSLSNSSKTSKATTKKITTKTTSKTDSNGNNSKTQSKSDYYFKGTTKPQYYNNKKLSLFKADGKTVITAGDLGLNVGNKNNRVFSDGNGKYYIWSGAGDDGVWLDITSNKNFVNKMKSDIMSDLTKNKNSNKGVAVKSFGIYG